MIEKQIHDILLSLAKDTFPDKNIKEFYINIVGKEMNSIHGDYRPRTRTIRVVNLSRPISYIISTSIHELSHHVECCIYGDSGHSKRFYQIYKDLLEKAIKQGIITYENILGQWDIEKLEKNVGKINASLEHKKESDEMVVKVGNCYTIKEQLKDRGYGYNKVEQKWQKMVNVNLVEDEKSFLKEVIDMKNVEITGKYEITLNPIYYISVSNCFDCKDTLKENGYRYKGYNKKGNCWVKKIKASDVDIEKKFLSKLSNIKIKIES